MKPIMNKEQYDQNLTHIAYNFIPYVFLISLVVIIIYQLLKLAPTGEFERFLSVEILADTFFKSVAGWGIVYFLKRSWLVRTSIRSYENLDVDDNKYFIPAIRGTMVFNSRAGMIFIDDEDIFFNQNRQSPETDKMLIPKSNVRFEVEDQKSNFMIRAFWGETKVLVIKDTAAKKNTNS